MFNKLLFGICFQILFVSYAQAQETRQRLVNDAIKSAENVCGVGTRYRFSADANGQLTILKLSPGGELKATVDNIQSKGSQFFDNQEIRRLVDQDIRLCMQAEWPKVLIQISERPPEPAPILPPPGTPPPSTTRNSPADTALGKQARLKFEEAERLNMAGQNDASRVAYDEARTLYEQDDNRRDLPKFVIERGLLS